MSSSRHLPAIRDSLIDPDIRKYQKASLQQFKEILEWIQYLISEYMNNIDRIFLGGAQDKMSILNNHVQKLNTAVSGASIIFPQVDPPVIREDNRNRKPDILIVDPNPAEPQWPFGSYQGTLKWTASAGFFLNVSIEMLLNDSPIDPDANAFAYSYDRSMHRCLVIGYYTGTVSITKPSGGSYNYRRMKFVVCYPGFGYTRFLDPETNNANLMERAGLNTWTDFKNICEDNREKYPLTGIPTYIPNAANPVWFATGIDKTPFVPMYPEVVDTLSTVDDSNKPINIDKGTTVHYVGYKLIWHVPYFQYVFDMSQELLENVNYAITNFGDLATKDYERYMFYMDYKTTVANFAAFTQNIYDTLIDIRAIGDQLESPLGQSLLGAGSSSSASPTVMSVRASRNKILKSKWNKRVRGSLKPTFKKTNYVKR